MNRWDERVEASGEIPPQSRRFTTPTADAAATGTLPTLASPSPLTSSETLSPTTPLAELQSLSRSPSIIPETPPTPAEYFSQYFPDPTVTHSRTASTCDTGLPSTSSVVPSILQSPRRRPGRLARLIPLENLIPAGTILLSGYSITPDALLEDAEDGWSRLDRGVLERQEEEEHLETMDPVGLAEAVDEPPILAVAPQTPPSPAKSSSKKGKGTRKAASSLNYSPKKNPKRYLASATPPHSFLDDVLLLQDSLVLRATLSSVDESMMLLRIYLIPVDVPERAGGDYTKGSRARPPSSTIVAVLGAIRMDGTEWEGRVSEEEGEVKRMMDEEDKRSILELYRAVDPPPNGAGFVNDLTCTSEDIKDRLVDALLESPVGMVTELFPYQKASLAKMLSRELAPQRSIHPSYLGRSSPADGSSFYVSVKGAVRREPVYVTEPKSGILAEDMGSGKTCICLALILSTVGELPCLDNVPTYLDGSSASPPPFVLTHLSRTFPFSDERDEERKLRPRVPEPLLPISELTALEIEKYQDAIAFQSRQDAIEIVSPLPSLRTLLVSLISTSPVAIPYSPSDTTLVATGLYAELENTIPYYNLHPSPSQLTSRSGRQGVARPSQIVVAATTLVVVPTDLVRQWQDEIEKHLEESALRVLVLRTTKDGFRTAEEMARFDVVLVSLARFSDDDATLRSVHWKRLIVDEGHTLSGANRMRKLAEELRCECRWAVSGTPSTNLRAATATDEGALFALDSTTGGNETDFHRLGQLFSRFLHHPAFPKVEDWRHSITVPIFEQGRGAARLAGVLERVIVRNSPERVKEAYVLPPLVSRLVEIELGEAERKTYNALLAVFATNSILSQRTDEDYLFAPKNKKYLDELTDNLAASSFFFASSNINRWLRGAVENSLEKLDSEKSLAWTVKDRRGLVRAVEVMQEALSDVEWQEIVEFTSIGLEVEGMDHDLVELFSGLKAEDNPRGPTILPLGQLVRLRRDLREVRKDDVAVWKDDEELREEVITFEERRRRGAEAPSTPAVKTTLTKKRKKAGEPLSLLPLPDDSVFRRITLGGSTSAKLNYVVDELRRYPEDKFVIFSSSLPDLIFASLSEAFDLLGITHSIFAGRAKNRDRGAMAARFNSTTASECQAILVDARLGGRGFCLTGASRVIMLEPIWQPDLEVQAAKRAHRLGQKAKVVHLDVLVVPGTYEDAMLKRRSQLVPLDFAKTKQPQRDSKLSDLLQSASYLKPSQKASKPTIRVPFIVDDSPASSTSPTSNPRPLPPVQPLPSFDHPSHRRAVLSTTNVDVMGGPPRKKVKKTVAFLTDAEAEER